MSFRGTVSHVSRIDPYVEACQKQVCTQMQQELDRLVQGQDGLDADGNEVELLAPVRRQIR